MATVIPDALRWWTRACPDRVALDIEGEQVTYARLGAWTDAVAGYLATEHGVRPGAVVGVAGANSVDWCMAALGALKAGAIVTPINFRYTASEVEHLVDDCSPVLVLADDVQAAKLAEVAARGHALPVVLLDRVRELDGVAATFHAEMAPSDPAVLAYTSGTTGKPKGLVYTHETILASMFELLVKDPTPPEETCMLLCLPLFSVAGIIHALTHMTSRGATVVVMRDFEPARALELLVEHRCSHMNGVPVIYERIAAQPGFDQHDLSHLKVAMVGGARRVGRAPRRLPPPRRGAAAHVRHDRGRRLRHRAPARRRPPLARAVRRRIHLHRGEDRAPGRHRLRPGRAGRDRHARSGDDGALLEQPRRHG